MKKHEAEKIIAVLKSLVEDDLTAPAMTGTKKNIVIEPKGAKPAPAQLDEGNVGRPTITSEQMERIYQMVKQRFIDELPEDPVLVHLIASRPEIIIELERKSITLEGSTLKGRVARLLADGFADAGRRTGEFRSELARTGADPNSGQLSTTVGEFVTMGFLTREGDRYKRSPHLKITEKTIEAK